MRKGPSTEAPHSRRYNASLPHIVSFGGGTGLSTLLRGLKKYSAQLSAIVTMTDDGGSSGRLREELRVLPPGDIRNCMIALSEDENLMARLFRYRFASEGDLHNHSFGNIFLTAMAGVTGDFVEAVRLTSEVLAIKGQIFPSTASNVSLKAEMEDGTWIKGETRITADRRGIRRVKLDPADARALPDALDAIRSADVITVGPGSLFTSLIPSLLAEGIVPAIQRSQASKIYVQNLMTQPGETDGYSVADHVRVLADHCSGLLFPTILLTNRAPSPENLKRYEAEHSYPVEIDSGALRHLGVKIIERDLLAEDGVIRHDPAKLAQAIFEITGLP